MTRSSWFSTLRSSAMHTIDVKWSSANQTTKNLSEIFFSRPRQYTLNILVPTQSKIVVGVAAYSKISRRKCFHRYAAIRISLEPAKYALDSVFQNLCISAYQWQCKAEFVKFFSVFTISRSVGMGPNFR